MGTDSLNAAENAKAVYYVSKNYVEVREFPLNREPGGLLVTSRLSAISQGTEKLILSGNMPEGMALDENLDALQSAFSFPVKYGYSNAGITETGEKVFCFYPHQDRFSIRPEDCIYLPGDIPYEDAVFIPNMETALGIVHDIRPVLGEIILIAGQGAVGLLTAEILVRYFHSTVITLEPADIRRSASEKIGNLSFRPENPEWKAAVQKISGGRGADCGINTSGSSEGLQLILDSLAFQGRAVEASWYGKKEASLNLGRTFHRGRLSIISSQVSNISPDLTPRWTKERRMKEVLELVREIRPSKYITHTFSLTDAPEAYDLILRSPEQTIQVVLKP